MSEAKPHFDPEAAHQVEQALGDPNTLEIIADLGSVLSDKSRIQIIAALTSAPSDVSTLVKQLEMTPPAVSHHLRLLRLGNLVTVERVGKRRIYSIDPTIAQAFVGLVQAVAAPPNESE